MLAFPFLSFISIFRVAFRESNPLHEFAALIPATATPCFHPPQNPIPPHDFLHRFLNRLSFHSPHSPRLAISPPYIFVFIRFFLKIGSELFNFCQDSPPENGYFFLCVFRFKSDIVRKKGNGCVERVSLVSTRRVSGLWCWML